jgi:protocatechuate 3,4-dioxygenase beta subunit
MKTKLTSSQPSQTQGSGNAQAASRPAARGFYHATRQRLAVWLAVLLASTGAALATYLDFGDLPDTGGSAIAVDATTTRAAQGASTITFNHTTGGGANRLMLVGISKEDDLGAATFTVASVTYGGQALARRVQNTSSEAEGEIWSLVNPPSGTATLVVTFTGAESIDSAVVGVTTFTGVNQTNPFSATNSATGTTSPASVTIASPSGEMVFGTLALDDSRSATSSSGQTQLWSEFTETANSDGIRGAGCVEAGAGSTTVSWSITADNWVLCAVSLKPAGSGSGDYPTLLVNDGPRHYIVSGKPRLGANEDSETNGQPNATATGDDAAGSPDDEDGVAIPALSAGETAALTVTVSGLAGKLDAWIDWNANGAFDTGERIATNRAVALGANTLNVAVPASASNNVSLGARFRISSAGNLAPTGLANDGEVEDYLVTVLRCNVLASAVKTDITCNGAGNGTITASATGGTAPYQFKLDSGSFQSSGAFTGVAAGAHTVTAKDANNCTATVNVTITQPAALVAAATKTDITCNGAGNGTITASATGGTAPYQFKLDSGSFQSSGAFTGVAAGAHTVTAKDANNCTATVNVTITQPTLSLGNRVFSDNGVGGGTANNGLQDGSEPGIASVVLKLFAADGSGNPTGSVLGTQTTDANGWYRFDGLNAGTYVVVVDVTGSGSALSSLSSSAGFSTDNALSGDLRDHGKDTPLASGSVLPGGIASGPVSLVCGQIPTGEATGTGAGANGPSGDTSDNLVVDFGFVSPDGPCTPGTFTFSGNDSTSGTAGNVKSYTVGGVSVKVTAWGRSKTADDWAPAYLGAYNGGLGVTDTFSDGDGGNNQHAVDNSGANNYLLFEFSQPVAIDKAYLGWVSGDSDLQIWLGTFPDPYNNHLTLSDAVLASFSYSETNTGGSSARWAQFNASSNFVNTLVVAARVTQANDYFKFESLDVCAPASTFSLGNRVFADSGTGGGTANDGIQNGTEPGIAGVVVKLFAADGSGNPTGSVLGTQTTDANGWYRFDGLTAGTYVVVVDVVTSGGALTGLVSSTGASTDFTLAGDRRDHGKDAALGGGSVLPGGIASAAVTVGLSLQPTGEATGSGAGANGPNGDASDNLVVDFGFVSPVGPCIPGTFDFAGNDAISGTAGNLKSFSAGGVAVKVSAWGRSRTTGNWAPAYLGAYGGGLGVTDTFSDGNGDNNRHMVDSVGSDNFLLFEFSQPVAVNRAYLGYVVTDSDLRAWVGTFNDPYNNHLTLNDSVLASFGYSETNLTSSSGTRWAVLNPAEVAGNTFLVAAGPGNTTYDDYFKLEYLDICVPSSGFSLGNRVFADNGAGGGTANNGLQDGTEPGIAGVVVKLFAADGSGNPTGSVLGTQTTDANGWYRFDGLTAGTYVVVVDVVTSGGALTGLVSSTGASTDFTLAGDRRDHGKDAALGGGSVLPGGIASAAVTVGLSLQPTGEATGSGAGANGPNGDASDNLVVDFGFTPTFSLGNRVFADNGAGGGTANNGLQDGTEPGIAGVVVKLYAADGSGNPTGSVLGTQTTDANGWYRFDGLTAGTYVVVVDVVTSGGALTGLVSSTGASTDFTLAGDRRDHGKDAALGGGSVLPGGIASAAVTVGLSLQPTGEATGSGAGANGPNGDASDNLVVDFGFTPTFSLGNRVFADNGAGGGTANNGLQDGTEPGIAGVVVKLYAADGSGNPTGSALGTQTTDANGWYRFDGLTAGTYVVVVDVAASGAVLAGTFNSTGASTDFALTGDLRDHGLDTPLAGGSVLPGGIASSPVTVGLSLQPTGEATSAGAGANGPNGDASDNLVVDFGFAPTSIEITATPYCEKDAPWVNYSVTAVGFVPGLATIEWVDTDGVVVQTLNNQPLTGTLLWPESAVDANGNGTAWPGWDFQGGQWVEIPTKVRPQAKLRISVNPTAEVIVEYPPGTPECAAGPYVSLGNLVFFDRNANGKFEPGDGDYGIDDVILELWSPGLDGVIGGGDDAPVDIDPLTSGVQNTDVSSDGGWYLFSRLLSGKYYVRIPADQFVSGAPLVTLLSSPGAGNNGVTDQDLDENGADSADPATDGTTSNVIDLQATWMPTGEVGPITGIADASDNLTLDFGFTPALSLGNRVFVDDGSNGGVRNNGIQDGGEPGLANVTIRLFAADGGGNPTGPVLATQVTDANGWYRFDGLTAGTYVAVVDVGSSPIIPAGQLVSSTGFSLDMALTGDLLDHGKDTPLGGGSVLAGGIASGPVTLGLNLQPLGEATGTGAGANGPTGDGLDNLVVDFGFVPPVPEPPNYSLGNRVFLDDGMGGGVANNGLQDGTEQGIAGVTVRLFLADVNGEPTGVPIDTQISDADGWYRFDGLPAGTYVVVVDVSASFLVLNGLTSSTGFSTALTLAGDLYDHGKDVALGLGTALPGGIASGPLTVGPGLQPLTEAVAGFAAGDHGPSGDTNDNLVVDFGFYRPSVTLASISDVSAEAQGGQVTVRWYTAIEIGTIAYDLERQLSDGTWVTVNSEPVFAWNSMVGASYAAADPGARARKSYLYRIVEYMDSGEVRRHGPYAVAVSGEPGVPVRITACEVVAGELRLTWEGGAGSYVLERSASLGADASWEGVPLVEPTATQVRLGLKAAAGFFRVYRVD